MRAKDANAVFASRYGKDEDRLEGWQQLCRDCHLTTIPPSITQCRKALKKLNINLVDFMHAQAAGTAPQRFNNIHELRAYTKREKKFFPKAEVKKNVFLKALMKDIKQVGQVGRGG